MTTLTNEQRTAMLADLEAEGIQGVYWFTDDAIVRAWLDLDDEQETGG